MASTTCKLQLLALAVLTSVLSVGSSLLLLLAWPGCCRGQPLVAVHVPLSVGLAQHGSPPDPLHWRVDRLPARNSSLPRGTPAGESTEILLKGEAMEATDSEANSSLSSVPTTTDLSRETEVTGKEEVQSSSVRGNNSFVMKKHKLSSKRLREIRQLARGNLTAPAGVSARVSKVLHTHNHSSPYGERKIDTSTPLPHLKWSPVTNITDIPLSALCPVKRCEHFLSEEERQIYQLCGEKASEWLGQRRGSECHCTFLNGTGRPTVALASLPGSGNTWLRGLLERATGVCTGSVFCDKTLRAGGMCGEGLRGSSVLGSKTHDTRLQWTGVHYKEGVWSEKRPFYDAAIVLVRNPYKAIIAEWNRQKAYRYSREQPGSSHVKYLEGPRFFCEPLSFTAPLSHYTTSQYTAGAE